MAWGIRKTCNVDSQFLQENEKGSVVWKVKILIDNCYRKKEEDGGVLKLFNSDLHFLQENDVDGVFTKENYFGFTIPAEKWRGWVGLGIFKFE